MTRRVRPAMVTVLLGMACAGCVTARGSGDVPATSVTRGDVSVDLDTSGEFIATRSQLLHAPGVGGSLRLVTLMPTGARVGAGDVVMAFDTAEQEFTLEVSESEVQEADLEIEKLDLERQVQAAQDAVTLLKARFDVRKAELDVMTNEVLGAVDARKNQLTLEETQRKLAQIEADVESRAATSEAAQAVAREKRQKAMLARDRAREAIAQMTVRAPFAGIVAIRQNQDAAGGFYYTGMTLPDYREGDTVFPGRPVLMLLDPAGLQVRARLPEALAASVSPGQEARLHLDGSRRAPLDATVQTVSGTANRSMSIQRAFDVVLALRGPADGIDAGRTVQVRIAGTPRTNVLSVPRQAVFDRDGTPTVFVQQDRRFVPTPVKVVARTQARVILDGVAEGTRVALRDPTASDEDNGPSASGGTSP